MKQLMENWRRYTEDAGKEVPDEVVNDLLQQLSDEGISIEDAEEYLKTLPLDESLEEGVLKDLAQAAGKFGKAGLLAALVAGAVASPTAAQAAGPDMHGYSDTMKSAPSLAFASDADFSSTMDKTMVMMSYHMIRGQTAKSSDARDLLGKVESAVKGGADSLNKVEDSIKKQGAKEGELEIFDAARLRIKDTDINKLISNADKLPTQWDALNKG